MSVPYNGLMLNQQFSPGNSTDAYNTPNWYTPTPTDVAGAQQLFAQFAAALQDIQVQLQAKTVGPDNILSTIALSPEAILIQSDMIGIAGQATFADWLRDVNGVSTGVLDPSVTTIRGGVIHTGIIYNADNSNYLNLDATGSTSFLVSSSGVNIKANGQFVLGSASGKQLIWDGTNLTIGSSSLLGTTTVSTLLSTASSALQAYSSYVLTGVQQVLGTGGVMAGSVTWNSSNGVVTGGSGVVMTQNGITGVKSGVVTFSIDTTGQATFAGNVNTGGYVQSQGVTTAFGTYQGFSLSAAGSFQSPGAGNASLFDIGVQGQVTGTTAAQGKIGVFGNADQSNGTGVLGASSAGIGVWAYTQTGTALNVVGPSNFSGGAVNFNGSGINFAGDGHLYYFGGGTTTGSATATFTSTNKPGSNTSNSWIKLKIDSTILYIPAWQ
jgi:hypothetical protein